MGYNEHYSTEGKMQMTKVGFMTVAAPLAITIAGNHLQGMPKNFSTGSSGWNANGKINVKLPNGEIVKAQVSLNIIAAGSKEWTDGDTAPVAAVAAPVVAPPAAPLPVTSVNSPI